MTTECTIENLKAAPDACYFACQYCEGESLINFHRLYYCAFHENLFVAIVFSLVILVSVFYMLGVVADRFLCPCLAEICKKLRVTQDLAGVTFLAFGNGANDVLSAFAAGGGHDDEGIYMSMGAILGSCLFVTTIVSSLVVLLSKERIIMNKEKFGRDLFVLLASIALLASFSFIGKIHWVMSLAFLVLYAGFIGYVVKTELQKKKQMMLSRDSGDKVASSFIQDTSLVATEIVPNDTSSSSSLKTGETKDEVPAIEEAKPEELPKDASIKARAVWIWNTLKSDVKDIFATTYYIKEYKEMTWFGKLMFFFVGAHFELLLRLSIPPYDKNKWDRRLAVIFPIFGGLLTFIQMRIFNVGVLLITFSVSAAFSVLIYLSTEKRKAPGYLLIFMFIGFVQSVQWMWFLCNISVDIFKLFIELSEVEPAYVGLTFMAGANSIGDIVSDTTMARMGYSVMAITAAFAGPIFNIMMGVGITMTRNIIKSGGTMSFDINEIKDFTKGNMLIFITLFTNILSLGVMIFIVFRNKFEFKKGAAIIEIGVYALFFLIVSILAGIMQTY